MNGNGDIPVVMLSKTRVEWLVRRNHLLTQQLVRTRLELETERVLLRSALHQLALAVHEPPVRFRAQWLRGRYEELM